MTPRLVIRCWQLEDAPRLKTAIDASLDHLQPWMAWAKSEPSELGVIEERVAKMRGEFQDGRDWAYGAWDSTEREVLGGPSGLHRRSQPDALEIGYWLRADMTGLGYATELRARGELDTDTAEPPLYQGFALSPHYAAAAANHPNRIRCIRDPSSASFFSPSLASGTCPQAVSRPRRSPPSATSRSPGAFCARRR